MRVPQYLSPSAIKKYYSDGPEAYYLRYLSDNKLPDDPQTQAMSIGSSFDAYVKAYLYEKLFGKGTNPMFEFETLFNTQVEPHNRDWALVHGKHAFELYGKSGALNDLYVELSQAQGTPHFETDIRGPIDMEGGVGEVPIFLGKPDAYFINKEGYPVILDWKVNGWCSRSAKSPEPGYVRLRHCDGSQPKSVSHKDAILAKMHGITINVAHRLETVNEDWAGQTAVYGWLVGRSVGDEFLTCSDQLVCKPTVVGFPEVRIAEHRTFVSKEYQTDYYTKARYLWNLIKSDHYFTDMSLADSKGRCSILDGRQAFAATDEGALLRSLTKTNIWR